MRVTIDAFVEAGALPLPTAPQQGRIHILDEDMTPVALAAEDAYEKLTGTMVIVTDGMLHSAKNLEDLLRNMTSGMYS